MRNDSRPGCAWRSEIEREHAAAACQKAGFPPRTQLVAAAPAEEAPQDVALVLRRHSERGLARTRPGARLRAFSDY